MRCNKSKRLKNMAAAGLCCLIACALILSSAFVLTHANHSHDMAGPGGCCSACIILQASINLLKEANTAYAAIGAVAFHFIYTVALFLNRNIARPSSLQSQRVRMNH